MENTIRYKAKFNYDGDGYERFIPSIMKLYIERLFIGMREPVVDQTNPKLEEWNNEFDKLYPDKDGFSIEYANFMISKFGPYVETANKNNKYPIPCFMRVWMDYEVVDKEQNFTDFVMKVNVGEHVVRVYITLEEM